MQASTEFSRWPSANNFWSYYWCWIVCWRYRTKSCPQEARLCPGRDRLMGKFMKWQSKSGYTNTWTRQRGGTEREMGSAWVRMERDNGLEVMTKKAWVEPQLWVICSCSLYGQDFIKGRQPICFLGSWLLPLALKAKRISVKIKGLSHKEPRILKYPGSRHLTSIATHT